LDVGLAAETLGWRPWTHLEDGLAETVAFMRPDGRPEGGSWP
jgi:nucleoside-diphosphate-sugar epimerase